MKNEDLLRHIDHTGLKATLSWDEILILCKEAMTFHTASVCIPPSYVRRVKEKFPPLNVCTVVGFPLGYQTTETKIAETKCAVADGADEIDMVINLGDVKNRDFEAVAREITAMKEICGKRILKVIVEACALTEDEKIHLCHIITDARADYIKTSTGFGSGGAVAEDITLFQKHIGEKVKIKAAGGISTAEDIAAFLTLGCKRIGTSKGVSALNRE